MVLFSAVIFIFKYNDLASMAGVIDIFGYKFPIITVAIVGFIINASVIVGLFVLAYSEKLHNFII
jgi:hypothetical protein